MTITLRTVAIVKEPLHFEDIVSQFGSEWYQAPIRCGNCFASQHVIVKKGVTINDALNMEKCVTCGVADLRKVVPS